MIGKTNAQVIIQGGSGSGATFRDYIDIKGSANSLFLDIPTLTDSRLSSVLSFSDTEYCSDMRYCFANTGITTIPLIDTSNVINMSYMLSNCINFISLPSINTSMVDNMEGMFSGCSSLVVSPQMNTQNVTTMYSMFSGCSSLTTVQQYDTTNVQSMNYMFAGCLSLVGLPGLDYSNVSYAEGLAQGSGITSVSNFDFSSLYSASYMFQGCTSLVTYTNVTMHPNDTGYMFQGCSSLVTVEIDFTGVMYTDWMFDGCTSLTNLTISGLLVDLDISASTEYSSATLESIIGGLGDVATYGNPNTYANSSTLIMGPTNIAKLSQTAIDTATAKGWTLA